ncbi:YeiH family protein [Salinigranum halophilum]|uniref:YeiH family protein n=1 Tax=Salinigranum halophilum TaxID=2565931 RepID=UPI0010A7F236|nr:putative sulfate exporter family transporter [Salinigranum halophilum]
MRSLSERLRALVPGLSLLLVLALAARSLAGVVGTSPLLVAVALGALVGNAVDLPGSVDDGTALHSRFLDAGIVLLGANVAVNELFDAGVVLVGLVVGVVLVGLPLGEFLGRWLGLDATPSSLLAAGASVCGVSAATTVAGILDARASDLTPVVAAILVFDAVTLAAFPVLGSLLDLSAQQFGVWAGLSMFSTGPVTAAGFAYGPAAGQWATVTKLARNALLGLVALFYVLRTTQHGGPARSRLAHLRAGVPPFILGFLVLAAAASAGLLGPDLVALADSGSTALFTLAFVGLGLDIRLDSMRRVGVAPLVALFGHLLVVSALTLVAVLFLL